VKRTGDMIRAGHSAFAGVPTHQEIRSIVVTAEPHYTLNSAIYREVIPQPGYPTEILSLGELEHAIGAAHAGDPEGLLMAITTPNPQGTFDVAAAVAKHEQTLGVDKARNPLLDEAYDRMWAAFTAGASKAQPYAQPQDTYVPGEPDPRL